MPNGADFLQAALDEIAQQNAAHDYIFSVHSDSTKGCGRDANTGDGAAFATQLYYTKRIKALFGPVCYEDLRITKQLIDDWNVVQFSFWMDASNYRRNSIVEMSTVSSWNTALNLIALLRAMKWDKVCPKSIIDKK
uniref:Peptidase_M28 domain-containing protein n=1 Tax=Ascaris lumbricoides TaxID=6252 RepID=A0A0M3IDB3_ASCLU